VTRKVFGTKDTAPPQKAHLLAPVDQLDFFHSRSCTLSRPVSAFKAWEIIRSEPIPFLRQAFWVRDRISALFGVKPIGGISPARAIIPEKGDRLDFFLVEYISSDVLVLTVRDRHLDVMTCISVDEKTVSVTTSVITHNWFGRAYMLPVAPAHGWIVRRSLAGLRRSQSDLAAPINRPSGSIN